MVVGRILVHLIKHRVSQLLREDKTTIHIILHTVNQRRQTNKDIRKGTIHIRRILRHGGNSGTRDDSHTHNDSHTH
jgi:hypothetical protein